MAVDWRSELKKFAMKKIKEMLIAMGDEDIEVTPDQVQIYEVPFEINKETLKSLEPLALARIFAHMIMREDFELVEAISEILKEKGYETKIDIDESKKTANIIVKKPVGVEMITIPMKIYPDGMIVDFEKEDDL
ncbi:MAG: hypothetical protein WC333_00405 [Dehalococcoidia bacterium]|jgi:predicted RNase H-related nuclease YkuK (DUF458 family)